MTNLDEYSTGEGVTISLITVEDESAADFIESTFAVSPPELQAAKKAKEATTKAFFMVNCFVFKI